MGIRELRFQPSSNSRIKREYLRSGCRFINKEANAGSRPIQLGLSWYGYGSGRRKFSDGCWRNYH